MTARSTKVDSFGLGMTCFAAFGARHPIPGEILGQDWLRTLRKATALGYDGDWKCIPERLARAIYDATKFDQADRLDFSSLSSRLSRIRVTLEGHHEKAPVDLVGEEVLYRIAEGRAYSWNDAEGSGEIEFSSGAAISIKTLVERGEIKIKIDYVDSGSKAHAKRNEALGKVKVNIEKYTRKLKELIRESL